MFSNVKFRGWILQNGNGRFWVRLLGENRAHTVTRFVFAPIAFLFCIAMILGGAFGGPVGG